jgi:zinc transport system substrate-binding protein
MNHQNPLDKTPAKRRTFIKILSAVIAGIILIAAPFFFFRGEVNQAGASEPLILVSVPPYKKMVQSLVGNKFRVESVVPSGFDPHLYEAKPKDMRKIKDAVLWFGIGEAFEYKLLDALKNSGSNIAYLNLVEQLETKGYKDLLIPFDEHHLNCCDHGHHHDSPLVRYDRHLWLGLELDSIQSMIIVEKLTELYPYFKGVFEGYLEELMREHDVLINWIESNIKDSRPITFLTPHPAYSYFAKEFDVVQIPIEVAGKEPNIQDLNKLLADVRTQKVDCVIIQPQHSKKAAEYIAKDLDIPVYMIDPYNENYLDTCNRLALSLANKRKSGSYAHN